MSLYVDDMLVIGSNLPLLAKFKMEMEDIYEMSDLWHHELLCWNESIPMWLSYIYFTKKICCYLLTISSVS